MNPKGKGNSFPLFYNLKLRNMSTVKIQTLIPGNFGCPVLFGELKLTFDRLGFAEVESEDIAKELATNYEGWLVYGELPKKELPAQDLSGVETAKLAEDLERLTEKIGDREATIEAISKECTEWKAQVELYKKKAEDAETELEGFKTQQAKVVSELELQVGLTNKTSADLVEFCKTLEIPEEKYKGKNKPDLITIILDESRNK
jgi:hypothetical protein